MRRLSGGCVGKTRQHSHTLDPTLFKFVNLSLSSRILQSKKERNGSLSISIASASVSQPQLGLSPCHLHVLRLHISLWHPKFHNLCTFLNEVPSQVHVSAIFQEKPRRHEGQRRCLTQCVHSLLRNKRADLFISRGRVIQP